MTGEWLAKMAASSFAQQESEIRRHWKADLPYDSLQDGFNRLSALSMLSEIDRTRAQVAALTDALALPCRCDACKDCVAATRYEQAEAERDGARNALAISADANKWVHARAEAAEAEAATLTDGLQQILDYVPQGFISPNDDEDSLNYRSIARAALAGRPTIPPQDVWSTEQGER